MPPSELPPEQHCDHAIPLVEGARPVNIRSYRYPPALKDEIEAQVDAMLQQGLIERLTIQFTGLVGPQERWFMVFLHRLPLSECPHCQICVPHSGV